MIKDIFQINSNSLNNQRNPKIVTNKNGTNLVIWIDQNTVQDVYGKIFDDSGNILRNDFKITSYTSNRFTLISNACNIGDRRFLILKDDHFFVNGVEYMNSFGTIYDLDSDFKIGETLIGPNIEEILRHSGCGLLANNRILIVFNYIQAYYRIFNNDLSLYKEYSFVDNTSTYKQNVSLLNLSSGVFIIIWEENFYIDGSGIGIFYKSFNEKGVELISKTLANTFSYNDQKQASLTQLKDNSVIVVFSSYGDGNGNGIYFQFIIICPSNRFIDTFYYNRCSLCDSICNSCIGSAKNCLPCAPGYYSLEPNRNSCINTKIPDNYLKLPTPIDGYYLKCDKMCGSCINFINN